MSARGFTLAELLAVLVVLGVGAAVAAPALRPPDEAGPAVAAAALREVYAGARGAAALRGVPVAVEVDAAGAFQVLAELPGGAPDTLRRGRLPLGADGAVAGPAGVRARFTPLGRARGVPVALVGGGEQAEVAVDPWSGGSDRARP